MIDTLTSDSELHEVLNAIREAIARGTEVPPAVYEQLERLLRICLKRCLLGQHWSEALSDVFNKLWVCLLEGRLPAFEDQGSACGYLCRMARNEQVEEWRHKNRQGRLKRTLKHRVPHKGKDGRQLGAPTPASSDKVEEFHERYRQLSGWYVERIQPARRDRIREDCEALQAIYAEEDRTEEEVQEVWGIAKLNTLQKRFSRARAGLCDAIKRIQELGPDQRPEWAHDTNFDLLRNYVRHLKR